jgi:hypothetical protein
MAKKYPSELNTRTVRITIGDYALLREISLKMDVTMAEALHLVITEQAKRETISVPRSQIPMPVFRLTGRPTIVADGNKHVAFVIKPRGGIIRG